MNCYLYFAIALLNLILVFSVAYSMCFISLEGDVDPILTISIFLISAIFSLGWIMLYPIIILVGLVFCIFKYLSFYIQRLAVKMYGKILGANIMKVIKYREFYAYYYYRDDDKIKTLHLYSDYNYPIDTNIKLK